MQSLLPFRSYFFFFNDTATTEIYTLSLHDSLPISEKAGVALGGWSTGATWGDYDRDGLLDLFVPGYVHYDLDHPVLAGKGGVPEGACQYRGVNVFCGPLGLLGEGDHLFHNNGDGSFTDVSLKAGVADRE